MQVANHRRPAFLSVRFRVFGAPLLFSNPANQDRYLPFFRGEQPAVFNVEASRTYRDPEPKPYNQRELEHLARSNVDRLKQLLLDDETQLHPDLQVEIISAELTPYNPDDLP